MWYVVTENVFCSIDLDFTEGAYSGAGVAVDPCAILFQIAQITWD